MGHKIGAPKGIAALCIRKTCLDKNGYRNIPYLVRQSGIIPEYIEWV